MTKVSNDIVKSHHLTKCMDCGENTNVFYYSPNRSEPFMKLCKKCVNKR